MIQAVYITFEKLLQNLLTPHLSFMEKPRYNCANHVLLMVLIPTAQETEANLWKLKLKKRANNPQFIDVDLRPMDGDPWNSQRKKVASSIQVNLEQNISLGLICSLTKQIIIYIIFEMIPCYLCKFEIPKLTEVLLLNKDQSTKQWRCQLCGIHTNYHVEGFTPEDPSLVQTPFSPHLKYKEKGLS